MGISLVYKWYIKPGFHPRSSHKNTLKWYLIPPCLTLSTISYGSEVSGAMQGMELRPPLHFGVLAIETELSGQPQLRSPNLTSPLAQQVDRFPMALETRVQSQVEWYRRFKMVFDSSLLNNQHYKVWIMGNIFWAFLIYLNLDSVMCFIY